MKFKTRMINAAVAAALGTVAGAAQAVNLGTEGQGQVLIYPYYTVQTKTVGGTSAPFDTYISIVNSDSVAGKAVKVRFLEAKNSQEVLDFNLYLSPNDMWTAAITRDGSGNAMLSTSDNSCTAPEILSGGVSTTVAGAVRTVSFTNFAYTNDNVKDSSLARAKEGYVEVIQMADLLSGVKNGDGLDTWLASKHVGPANAAVPPNCGAIRNSWLGTGYDTNQGVNIPTGGLSGAGTIVNVNEGTDLSYDAVPMVNFSQTRLHFSPGNVRPALFDVNPAISEVFQTSDLVVTDWSSVLPTVVPVTAILMRNQLLNEYASAGQPVGLATDWVVTMPTKRDHVNFAPGGQLPPFTSYMTTTGACEAVTLTAYNREEATQTSGLQFSPSQSSGNSLCWEANVIAIRHASVVGNPLGVLAGQNTRLDLTLPFTEGWLRMTFNQTLVSPPSTTRVVVTQASPYTITPFGPGVSTYTGLPVLGFAAVSFVNNASVANYGTAYTHRYYRKITP